MWNLVSIECPKVTAVGQSVIFVRCVCPMCESWPDWIYLHGSLSYFMAASITQISWVSHLTPKAKVGRWKDCSYLVLFFTGDGFMRKETIFYTKHNVGLILWFILLSNVFQVMSLFSNYNKHKFQETVIAF